MKPLVTENPKTNTETLLNYSYMDDNKRVRLRYGHRAANVDLCEYLARATEAEGWSCCGKEAAPEIMENGLQCDCMAAILYTVAVQAAELRERLRQYEAMGDPEEILKQQKELKITRDFISSTGQEFELIAAFERFEREARYGAKESL